MSKPTILVVDDDRILLEGFGVVLAGEGYEVHKAKDAGEGLAFLGCQIPDLILLDMMIPSPGRDGWFFLNEVRKKPAMASIPVVIITAIGVASRE